MSRHFFPVHLLLAFWRHWTILPLLVLVSLGISCGGSHPPDNPPPTTCFGIHCASLAKRYDVSCPQISGKNNRTYASATQANLTVFFFYLLNQYDGAGNVTPFQQTATLNGSAGVPLSCDYDFKNGTQYQYDIVKECATTRTGATLATCTSEEKNLLFTGAKNMGALTTRSNTALFMPKELADAPSSCTQICQLTSSACLKIAFTKEQTVDLDKATGILFGFGSHNPISGCKQSVDVSANASQHQVSVSGTDDQCVVDIDSRAGTFQILVTRNSSFNTRGDHTKFVMAPSTEQTAVVKLPIDDWQNKYGGRVLETEGDQASTVITTENGCIRLQRFH